MRRLFEWEFQVDQVRVVPPGPERPACFHIFPFEKLILPFGDNDVRKSLISQFMSVQASLIATAEIANQIFQTACISAKGR